MLLRSCSFNSIRSLMRRSFSQVRAPAKALADLGHNIERAFHIESRGGDPAYLSRFRAEMRADYGT